MKPIYALAALFLATTAAHAGDSYSFDVGGRTVTIEAPSDCRSTDCISISIPGVYQYGAKHGKRARDTDTVDEAKAEPVGTAIAAPQPAPVAAPIAPAASLPATVAPSETVAVQPPTTPPTASQPAPTVVASAPVAEPIQKQQVAVPAPVVGVAASPLGIWMTEKKEGKVRIEQCGINLCGYSINAKTNANGDKVLINMKPGSDKWAGKIFDPNSGSTYDSTIALKSADSLRVQGCAFGGMFCGGQTWTRIN